MAAADKTLQILLQVQSDVAELQRLNSTLGETKQKLQESGDAGAGLNSAMAGFIGGAVAGGIGVIANTLAEIPQRIAEARQEVAQWTADIAHMRFELADQEEEWFQLAQAASNFGDVAQISQKLAPTLADAAAQMEEFRNRELGFWARWADTLASLFTAPGFVLTKPFQTALDKARKDTADTLLEGINAGNDATYIAKQSAEDWAGLLSGPVDQGIAKVRANIEQLKSVQSSLDLKRLGVGSGSTPDQLQGARAALDQSGAIDRQLLVQGNHLEQLTRKQDEQTSSVKKTALELETLTAKRSQDAEAIAKAAGNKAYEQEIEGKKKLGILDADAIAKANQIRQLMHDNVLAQEQQKGASQGTRDAHGEIRDILAAEREQLEAIKSEIQSVESDPFLTTNQKNSALSQIIPKEIKNLNDQIAFQKSQLKGSALDPAQATAAASAIRGAGAQMTQLNTKLQLAKSPLKQFQAELVKWVNSFGTIGQQFGNLVVQPIHAGFTALSGAITGLITKTTTWGQAFAQVGQAIISSLVQILVQFIESQVAAFILRITLGKASEQATNSEATAAASAWAPAAALAATASYGAAAGIGQLAVLAAMISTQGAAVALSAGGGAFEAGGYTGDGASNQPAGIVHRGEWVHDAVTVNRAGGPAFFENLKVAINRPGYERGGSVGASSSRSGSPFRPGKRGITIIQVRDEREAMKELFKSRDAETHIVRVVNGRGGHLRT